MNFIKQNNLITEIKLRNKHRPNSLRLRGYDYSSNGAYFITICTKNRQHYFGEIINGELRPTEQAKICLACWLDLSNHYDNCILDAFVIMPDHVHMIIVIQNNDNKRDENANGFRRRPWIGEGAGLKPAPAHAKPAPAPVGRGYHNAGFVPISEILIYKQFKPYPVSEIVRAFKTFTARKINNWQNTPGQPFWQTRFHDRIIRDDYALNRIRKYIINNPVNWGKNRL